MVFTNDKINQGAIISIVGALLLFLASMGAYSVTAGTAANDEAYSLEFLSRVKLTDQYGNRVKAKDLRDKVVLLNFFFTSCGGACPVQTAVVKEVQSRLNKDVNAVFISVSIAPVVDTHEAVDAYLKKFDVGFGNWLFASGSVKDTEKLIEKYRVTVDGVTVVDGQADHRDIGYLFGRKGNLMQQYQLKPGIAKRLSKEMKMLFDLKTGDA